VNVRRRGFTLIEILVVIGIILVLVGIVSVGIGYVTKAGKNNSVKVTLNNLRGMITELEASAGLASRQPTDWAYSGNGNKTVMPTGANVWKDNDPSTPATNDPAFVPAGSVIREQSENDGQRYGLNADAVVNTQLIMQVLIAVPKNRTMLSQLPQGSVMEKLPGSFTPKIIVANNASDRTPNPPIPLDPWGNPIIFVSGAGLCGASNTASDPKAMFLGGTDPNSADVKFVCNVTAATGNQVPPVRSPDGRPFWASAGPDGDFRTGDDNVYSFEN
jgi:prepilin-type N-terminal cleavage/methylation domain-containing protein